MDSKIPYNDAENIKSHLSTTQQFERACNENNLQAELTVKDEAARRLRVQTLLLEHENEDLGDQLIQRGTLVDQLHYANEDVHRRLGAAEERLQNNLSEMRLQSKETRGLKIELSNLHVEYANTKQALAEKVALSRENSSLRQELEHFRSQVLSQQTTLSEKLDLERQVKSLEVQLALDKKENRALKKKVMPRSPAPVSVSLDYDDGLPAKTERLETALAHEKQLSEILCNQLTADGKEKAAAFLVSLDEIEPENGLEICRRAVILQRDLAREIEDLEQARSQVKGLEKKLEKERERRQALERKCAEKQQQIEALQNSASVEQNHQAAAAQRQATDMEKKIADMETKMEDMEQLQHQLNELKERLLQEKHDLKASKSRNNVLESKLEQRSTELKTTKGQLKKIESELRQVQSAAILVPAPTVNIPTAKNQRKRPAVAMQESDPIGTPDAGARGRRPANRKGRMEQMVAGEKSMFSITPFLNRTVNMSANTMPAESHESNENEPETEVALDNVQSSPSGARSKGDEKEEPVPAKSRPKAQRQMIEQEEPREKKGLTEATVTSGNKKPALKKPPRTVKPLAKVTEEDSENEENSLPTKAQDGVQTKEQGMVAEEKELKKKKRKLLGGGGRTLFDDDDGELTKRPLKSSLASSKLSGKGGLAGPKGLRGGLQNANGFGAFSPLKKDRRGVGASFLG
ncbi:hypothetical protein BP6252_13406 [Coleophoma cylindrospora]|uniref:Uncharacterized protein n=1 Tax=Coleophoma cylindrospora TaxID=1849047 RepID=A0A3D8Q837_9HELO|nr:hypothetical protein BP6252_13406 [Coleophoma cylindrospora]